MRGAVRWTTLRGDLAGGITSAVLTLPVAAGLGILALSPLGPAYVPYGILAGLYSAIIVPLAAVAAGARGIVMYSPRSVLAFLVAAIALQSLARLGPDVMDLADVPSTLGALFFVVFLAGAFQAVFGVFRFGALVKYIPSPVMAGFQNAGAILIFFAQLAPLLGLREPATIWAMPSTVIGGTQPLTLLVGATTIAVMWCTGRYGRGFPPTIAALVGGTIAYYAIAAIAGGGALGPVIGEIPRSVPVPAYAAGFFRLILDTGHWHVIAVLVSGALSLAIIAALDGLLSARTMEAMTGERAEGSRTLINLGVGNMATACFGGTPGGLNLVGTLAARDAGATTRAAVLASGIVMLIAVAALPPLIARIPRVVIAGMLILLAIQFVDRWTVEMILKLSTGRVGHWRRMAFDLFVVALVATSAIALNLVVAVGVGIAVAVFSFLLRMSRSVVRRAYHGGAVQSRRTRDPRLMEVLGAHGASIHVFELEGPLFFGTAEDLSRRVEAVRIEGARFVILDFTRVNEVDSTGARILVQMAERLEEHDRSLLLSRLPTATAVATVLHDLGVTAAVRHDHVFHDIDRALEWAEDELIRLHAPEAVAPGERAFASLDVMAGLGDGDRAAFARLLVRRHYARGEIVFREGDIGRDLYIIAAGAASVTLRLAGEGRENRLATFSAGTIFGELALLDPGPRSATIVADEDLVCYVLGESAFDRLQRDHPAVAIAFLTNLGRELTRRLRRANRTIYQLEG